MLKRFSHTLWATVTILFFAGGMVAGAYYHTELGVWWAALTGERQPVATAPAELPEIAPDTSVLEMKQLDSPLPLVFSDTLDEGVIQEHLRNGAVVLPLGTSFGEQGNVVVTAHSTGTTSFGPYRFAFAKLSELKEGDEFSVKTPHATYTYRVFGNEIVWPHEVDKLPNDDRSTVTLVTCWPLWTNFKRLLVHGELVNVAYN